MRYTSIMILVSMILSNVTFAQESLWDFFKSHQLFLTPMYEQVSLPDNIQQLQSICDNTSLQYWRTSYDIIRKRLEYWLQKLPEHKKLQITQRVFEKSISILKVVPDTWTLQEQCRTAHALLLLMDKSRDIHIQLLHDSWIIHDFSDINIQDLYGADIKIALLQDTLSSLKKFENLSLIWLQFTNTWLTQTQDTDKKHIYNLLTQLMKWTVQQVLSELQKSGILSEQDILQFQNHIVLEFTNSCSNFHGSYNMKSKFTNNILTSQEVSEMKILINLCFNYHILQDIWNLFYKIVLHELWHHIYYQKDKTKELFEQICWINASTQIPSCTEEDFVSSYAMTNALEDYAEQFMYSYLRITPGNNSFLNKKDNYFLMKYPSLSSKSN